MSSILTTIQNRVSIRNFTSIPVEETKLKTLLDFTAQNNTGPFGNQVRFMLVDVSGYKKDELKNLGTYGMIRGAKFYLAAAVKKEPGAMEDHGYCMEKAILKATELGLGTCWLGGTFSRSVFSNKLNLQKDEVIPGITPVGYASVKKRLFTEAARFVIHAAGRKEWNLIFFNNRFKNPLDHETAGKYENVLEAVRKAPSASNKQPWRIVKETGRNNFYFFLDEEYDYNHVRGINIQNVDMGIAMSHFEAAVVELGLKGSWSFNKPGIEPDKKIFIAGWIGK